MLPSCLPPAASDRAVPMVIRDSFTRGTPELAWRPYPYFNQDNLAGALDPSSPEGEPGVGVLNNGTAGGFAALSYAETRPLADFRLEAWLHVQVTDAEKGALNGIAFRVDPREDKYYRFATHFTAEPSLSLAYVGKDTRHFPVEVAQWQGVTLPGGPPKRSGWHRVVIEVKNDAAEIFWDATRLSGGPFRLDRIGAGYVGVYATYTGGRGRAETKIDGLRIEVRNSR
ncbi:MAG TPA: hypothetical protein VNO43_15315 [Candidatus Eisenbacteria bacterium]|nr:hypothetical protein [Candidatus Eisenbacteria bacterium]